MLAYTTFIINLKIVKQNHAIIFDMRVKNKSHVYSNITKLK